MNAGRAPIRSCRHVALLILGILAPGMAGAEPVEIVETDEVFKSKGQSTRVDVFSPKEPGKYPAVLVLHGHGGVPDEGKRSGTHALARHMAGAGYVALVPHYRPAGLQAEQGTSGRTCPGVRHLGARGSAPKSSRIHAGRRSDVDPEADIGVLGTSMGSYVALSVAARDRRVSAVVEHIGGWPEWEGDA